MNVSVETPESKRLLSNISQPAYPISIEGITAVNGDNINSEQDDGRMLTAMTGETVGPPVSVNMEQSYDNTYQHAMAQNQRFSERSDSFPPGPLDEAKSVVNADTLRVLLQATVNSPGSDVLQGINRPPSPSLFSSSQGLNQLMHNHQAIDLQGHHSGVLDAAAVLRAGQNVQMEISIDPASGGVAVSPVSRGANATHVADLYRVEQGRSSASNSDVDSESDFDDSASDRSDGSDFDPGTATGLSEPFTAARVLALNRMQQQHRREQYLQDRALRQVAAFGTTNFQPSPDSDYQNGDSIDYTLAEESCGSDSSSSDCAD